MVSKKYRHCSLPLAKLRLKGLYSEYDLDEAEDELLGKGYVEPCTAHLLSDDPPGHEFCVRLLRV